MCLKILTILLFCADFTRGCVTPEVLKNVEQALDGDFELLEGFGDLDEDLQEKVMRAIAEHHVDDDDWRGVSVAVFLSTWT